MKVKICGLTRYEDAAHALECGANFLGFIFYASSPRGVTPEHVAQLVSRLRTSYASIFATLTPPQLVGVFVNDSPAHIATILDTCTLDLAQLSGDEVSHDYFGPDSPLSGRAYKAIRPRTLEEGMDLVHRYTNYSTKNTTQAPRILIDTPHQHLYGGTGQAGDWKLAGDLSRRVQGVMLAGGLNALNVGSAIRAIRPYAVDVAGGVEAAPGIKDHDLVRRFIENAKSA